MIDRKDYIIQSLQQQLAELHAQMTNLHATAMEQLEAKDMEIKALKERTSGASNIVHARSVKS